MSKGNKNRGKQPLVDRVLLATAILNLIKAIVDLINRLIE